jgi:hypothetical protein
MEMSGQFHSPAAFPPGKGPPSIHWIGGFSTLDMKLRMINVQSHNLYFYR